jgi:outer membrane protein OmpA-like peptidoglycan-associated protein
MKPMTGRLMTLLAFGAMAMVAALPARADQACRTASEIAGKYQPVNVQFDTGSAVVKPDDQKRIADLARIARASKIQQICIKGFTDKQGNPDANRKLSQARAEAVAAEFGKNGITRDYLAITSGGEPGGSLFGGVDAKSQADRRVEVRIAR